MLDVVRTKSATYDLREFKHWQSDHIDDLFQRKVRQSLMYLYEEPFAMGF